MKESETSTVSSTAQEIGASQGEPLIAALQSLYRAYQKTTIYPLGHPAVPESLGWAMHEFEPVLDEHSTVLVGVGRDRLLIDDEALTEPSGALRSLAALLHDLDVAALEFRRGLAAEELQFLIEVISECRREQLKGPSVVSLLRDMGAEHLVAIPIDYGALHFAEGARDDAGARHSPDVWKNLVAAMVDPSAGFGESSPTRLARQVGAEIQKNEGTGIAGLRRQIRGMRRRIDSLDSKHRGAVKTRLRHFISALKPDLRGDLLRVSVRPGDDGLSTLSELADVVPEPDLLDALQQIDRAGRRVPGQVLTLMNKLVRISNDRPSLASGLEDVLAKWGVKAPVGVSDPTETRAALEEVFQRRTDVSPNPADYQDLLDDLGTSDLTRAATPLESKYRDPRDKDDLRLHAAEVAVLVLGKACGDTYRAGLFGYVEASAERLLSGQRFDAVRDAAVSARSYSLLRSQGDDTRKAASAFLEEFSSEKRILQILEHACEGGEFPEAAVSLLGLGGDCALTNVIDCIGRGRSAEIDDKLIDFAVGSGADRIAEQVGQRWAGGWPPLRPLFQVIRRLEAKDGVRLLRRVARHEESRVRREAILLLCEVDPHPLALERHLRGGLCDEDSRLVSIAIFRLSRHGSRAAIDLLGRFIRGQLGGGDPSPGMTARAARSLPACGEPGLVELRSTLESLRWSLQPRKALRGSMIAEVLGEQPESADTTESLRRWSRSPACAIVRLDRRLRRLGSSRGAA